MLCVCPLPLLHSPRQSATLSTNDIVINKLTQILSYLRQGSHSGKRGKRKGERIGERLDHTLFLLIKAALPTVCYFSFILCTVASIVKPVVKEVPKKRTERYTGHTSCVCT